MASDNNNVMLLRSVISREFMLPVNVVQYNDCDIGDDIQIEMDAVIDKVNYLTIYIN